MIITIPVCKSTMSVSMIEGGLLNDMFSPSKAVSSAHTATARQLTSWLSSLAMVSGLHFALATTWRWSLRVLALYEWLRSARKAVSGYLRGIAWVGSTYRWSRGCIQYKKVRGTEVVVLLTDSYVNMIVSLARRSRGVRCSTRVGGARRRVLDLRGAKEELSRATNAVLLIKVCRLTDIVRQLAKLSCPSPRLEPFSLYR